MSSFKVTLQVERAQLGDVIISLDRLGLDVVGVEVNPDLSDIPEVGREFFRTARLINPPKKRRYQYGRRGTAGAVAKLIEAVPAGGFITRREIMEQLQDKHHKQAITSAMGKALKDERLLRVDYGKYQRAKRPNGEG